MTEAQDRALDALYAELPAIECAGLCWDSCGPIDMSAAERTRIARVSNMDIPRGNFLRDGPSLCPALTIFKRCSVYEIRPLICRIWGLTKMLPCSYGCRPDRWLTEPEAYELIARAHEISGDQEQAEMARMAARPEHQDKMRTIRRQLDLQSEVKLRRMRGES